MKVIDLLNKIANGEELPKKIKINSSVLTLNEDEDNYLYDTNDEYWGNLFIHWFSLNDEVEVIEDKKIEKLGWIEENTFSKRQNGITKEDRRLLDNNFKVLGSKIDEIIDKINEE